MSDRSGKTEQPTPQRLDKARKEGQFPSAREFVAALQFMVFLALVGIGGAKWFRELKKTARALFSMAFEKDLRPEDLTHLAWKIFRLDFVSLVIGGAAVAL